MFDWPHHQHIAKLLACLDAEFLAQCKCYFGGGTAIALSLGEYRVSLDVDFLCSSKDGYRTLRNTINTASLGRILYRSGDLSVLSRDAIDLAMLIEHWGAIPEEAWTKSRRAYGQSIDTAYRKAIELVSDSHYLASCLKKMHMEPAWLERIPALLRSSLPTSESAYSTAP